MSQCRNDGSLLIPAITEASPTKMIPLHRPWFDHREEDAAVRVVRSGMLGGNGVECAALEAELGNLLGSPHVLATTSATHTLELAMYLLEIRGGEVIVPSFTFPSVCNAVLQMGRSIRFCEIRSPDLNVDLDHAYGLIGPGTRALVVTHYAGHPLDFRGAPVPVVEDAAHALGSTIAGQFCGTLGVAGCLSFHQTKNVAAGEGGALLLRSAELTQRAKLYREKGTNRDDFMAGAIERYSWMSLGSSFVLPEVSAAIARVQLRKLDRIVRERTRIAELYDAALTELERTGQVEVVRPIGGHFSSHHIYGVLAARGRSTDS